MKHRTLIALLVGVLIGANIGWNTCGCKPAIEFDILKIQQACNARGENVKEDGKLTPNGDGETETAMNILARRKK